MYDELAEYSEDNFESMVESWRENDRDITHDQLSTMVRWWVKFSLVIAGTCTAAFILGYALARLS